jgi:hypothetical protein
MECIYKLRVSICQLYSTFIQNFRIIVKEVMRFLFVTRDGILRLFFG